MPYLLAAEASRGTTGVVCEPGELRSRKELGEEVVKLRTGKRIWFEAFRELYIMALGESVGSLGQVVG